MARRFILLFMVLLHPGHSSGHDESGASFSRSSFPPGFVFGTASSAYQYEGAAREGGREASIWDTFTHQHLDGSLSGGVNREGIQYYNNIINQLVSKGLKPFVTLFHWDSPQTLEDQYGGFLSHHIVDDFRRYAEVCFGEFGDRVKHWITFNEPWTFSTKGYSAGSFAPARCSSWISENCSGGNSAREPYIVAHLQLLAHAATVIAIQKQVPGISEGEDWDSSKLQLDDSIH